MIYKHLQATFGRLENEHLDLHEGLNVITCGNESGKSTWAELICAMLYGVDTRSRARAGELPVKTKYAPWSGKPMEGRLELEKDGQNLVLQRTSLGGPLARLTVTDADSGLAQQELSSPRCGELLTGVEAGVFERSALIRQRQSRVTPDPKLEQRLSSLVTAAEEDYAYAEVDGALKKLQNSIWYNQSGELPLLREAMRKTEAAQGRIAGQQERLSDLSARIKEQQEEQAELTRITGGLRMLELNAVRDAHAESETALDQARQERADLEKACAALPPKEELVSLRTKLRSLRSRIQTAAMEEGLDPIVSPEPPQAGVFARMDAKQALAHAAEDVETVLAAEKVRRPDLRKSLLFLIPALVLLALAPALWFFLSGRLRIPCAAAAGGLGMVLLGLGLIALRRALGRFRRQQSRRAGILAAYDAESAADILERAKDYVRRRESYERAKKETEEKAANRAERARVLTEEQASLLEGLHAWAPDAADLDAAETWAEEAAKQYSDLEQARRTELVRAQMELRLRDRVRLLPEAPGDLDRFRGYDPAEIQTRVRENRELLAALQSEYDRTCGALEGLGDPLILQAEAEEQARRAAALERRFTALVLARKVLEQADGELRARFAPLLCKKAGELFCRLTEGAYDAVSLDRELHVNVHPAGSPVDRPLAYLSGGTVDQLYLALRLAVCDLLIPEVPVILDDALVFFDDERARIALSVLRELSASRQILLFTCQNREERLLASLRAEEASSRTEPLEQERH